MKRSMGLLPGAARKFPLVRISPSPGLRQPENSESRLEFRVGQVLGPDAAQDVFDLPYPTVTAGGGHVLHFLATSDAVTGARRACVTRSAIARLLHALNNKLQKLPLNCINTGARYWD